MLFEMALKIDVVIFLKTHNKHFVSAIILLIIILEVLSPNLFSKLAASVI